MAGPSTKPPRTNYTSHNFGGEDGGERPLGTAAAARARIGNRGTRGDRFDFDVTTGDARAAKTGAAEAGAAAAEGGRTCGVEGGVAIAAGRRREDAAAADGAGGVRDQPGINAAEVEPVVTVGQQTDPLARRKLAQAHYALVAARGVQERI